MITLNFKIEPEHLAFHTLRSCERERFIAGQPMEKVVAFQNRAWELDRDASKFLRFGVTETMLVKHRSIAKIATRAEKLLRDMIADPTFQDIQTETEDALRRVREEWESDLPETSSVLQELTGLKLDKEIDVYITHPSQKNGSAGIFWTYRQDFPHYNTVYLWHEIMHHFLVPERHEDLVVNLEHAVIELLTDNELRIRLNGGEYPPFEGHDRLQPLRKALLKSWRSYLKQPNKDILQFVKFAKAKQKKEQGHGSR